MTDLQLLTLCANREAGGECDEGIAAVVQVVLSRTELGYASDKTIAGTIERHLQFSWTENDMVGRVYTRVAFNPAQELSRIEELLQVDEKAVAQWARCSRIVSAVMAGTFSGPLFDELTTHTVLYDNLALAQPEWVASSRHVVKIGHHDFFEPAQLGRGAPVASGRPVAPAAPIVARPAAAVAVASPSIEVDL